MQRRTRWLLIGLGLAAGAAVIAMPFLGSGIPVETAAAAVGRLEVTIVEDGRTRLRDRFIVAAPISGRLARIGLSEGDIVEKGATLARIYPVPEDPRRIKVLRAQVAAALARRNEATAGVARAKAEAAQAEREARRSRELADRSAVSDTVFERNQLAAETARRQVEAAQATLRTAEAELAAARAALVGVGPHDEDAEPGLVDAPAAGRILRLLERNERVVQAGTPLVEIGDLDALEVIVDVLSEDAVRIEPGDPVRISDWGGAAEIAGEVRLVEPDAFTETSALGVEEQRVNVAVGLPDAPTSLGSGFQVEAHIVIWSGEVLQVPTSALFRRDGAWHVFSVDDGTARLTPVEVGRRGADAAEIAAGLEAGTQVILFPSDEIADGVSVEPLTR